ncbi:MAG: hypothetical protein M1511_05880 [Deltaproteobacteria bacterium]|nr:hypothetical protein [Deltaproteobacteria bacterium]
MQIEQLAQNIVKELVSSGALEQAVAKATAVTSNGADNYTDDQKLRFGLRGDVMNLVGRVCERHNLESKIVFGELKKRTGVSQPEATPMQLQERIDLLQIWLESGMK